ncbi:MAG TPA: TetR/AcrR family transcriptional regulator [Puia sp.]|nr:TetR/AcrR family transcriptional regulator [Puia sp.]
MTKAEKTRQFIIEKSAPIFNTKGVAGTAMSDIMEATQLAKGSLYVHFENKDELVYCAVDYNLDSFYKKIWGAADKYTTAKDRIYAILDSLGDPKIPLIGGCPMLNFGMEADDTNPVILRKVNKAAEKVQELLAGIVRQGIAAGELRGTLNAHEFAIRTFALVEGGIMMARVSGNNKKLKLIVGMIKKEIRDHAR